MEVEQAKEKALVARAAAIKKTKLARTASLKAQVHKDIVDVVDVPDLSDSLSLGEKSALQQLNKELLSVAQTYTAHITGRHVLDHSKWDTVYQTLSKRLDIVKKMSNVPQNVVNDVAQRTHILLESIGKECLKSNESEDEIVEQADISLDKQGSELQRTKTLETEMLQLNPEGDLRKSDTDFYAEMFGGGGGDDKDYDLQSRRQKIEKRRHDEERCKKATHDAKLQKRQQLARIQSGIRIATARKAEHAAVRMAKLAECAEQEVQEVEAQALKVISLDPEPKEIKSWLFSTPQVFSQHVCQTCLNALNCVSKDNCMIFGENGAWTDEQGFINNIEQFVYEYGATQAAVENVDVMEVTNTGFSHEYFWDLLLWAMVSYIHELHKATFIIACGRTNREIESDASEEGEKLPRVAITNEFINVLAEVRIN